MRARRYILWGAAALILIAAIGYALRPQPIPVDFATIAAGPLVASVEEEGETRVRDIFVLSAPITGRVQRIESDPGDPVIAGETVVAQIEPSDPAFLDVRGETQARAAVRAAEAARNLAAAELDEARAELTFAQVELDRARRLTPGETISERAIDAAERSFETARAATATAEAALEMQAYELDEARARLVSPAETQALHGDCDCVPLTAPVSGRILRVLQESEGVVAAGTPLVEIGDPRDLEIVADLLSSDAVKVRPGQRVIIDQWGGGAPLNGKVRRIEPYGFTKVSALGIEEQRVNVIIDFTDPPEDWQALAHGFQVEARIVLWEGADVLGVPVSALFRDGDTWAVFVADDGRARLRHVTIGRRNSFHAEVRGGLDAGERIILHPSDRVVDGIRVARRL